MEKVKVQRKKAINHVPFAKRFNLFTAFKARKKGKGSRIHQTPEVGA